MKQANTKPASLAELEAKAELLPILQAENEALRQQIAAANKTTRTVTAHAAAAAVEVE